MSLLAIAAQAATHENSPSGKASQAHLDAVSFDAVSDVCKVPRARLKHGEGHEAVLRAPADAECDQVFCVIEGVKENPTSMSLDVIGNAPASENK